jgi:hypothetical protein
MVGKVLKYGKNYAVKTVTGELPINPNIPVNSEITQNIDKNGFCWIEFTVDTIAIGVNEFDVMDCDVATILNVYDETFGTMNENVSVATKRYENNRYPIGGFAPGNYINRCTSCGSDFVGDKLARQCELCVYNMLIKIN